jgi:dihydroorotate dehydrogenase
MSDTQLSLIDLAPGNPYSLVLDSPLLMAPGCAVRDLPLERLGALVTRIVTRHTRHEPPPRVAATPAGLVVTSFPSISIRTLLKEDARHWQRSRLPVIVCLQGEPDELGEMVSMLENVESVAAILLMPEERPATATAFARQATQRPLLAMLEIGDDLQSVAQQVVAAGADALVIGAPVQATAGTELIEGWLLGPAALPLTLRALSSVRAVAGVPLIALGGIAGVEHVRLAMAAGATALMIDAARWGDPHAPALLAERLGISGR